MNECASTYLWYFAKVPNFIFAEKASTALRFKGDSYFVIYICAVCHSCESLIPQWNKLHEN